jgi:hypothetical protein
MIECGIGVSLKYGDGVCGFICSVEDLYESYAGNIWSTILHAAEGVAAEGSLDLCYSDF